MALGLTSRVTMITIVGFAIVLTIGNIEISKYLNVNILLLANLIGWILLNMWMTKSVVKKNKESDFNK